MSSSQALGHVEDNRSIAVTWHSNVSGSGEDDPSPRLAVTGTSEQAAEETLLVTSDTFSCSEWRSLHLWGINDSLFYEFKGMPPFSLADQEHIRPLTNLSEHTFTHDPDVGCAKVLTRLQRQGVCFYCEFV